MKNMFPFRFMQIACRSLARILGQALVVCAIGIFGTPAMASVTVDQQPLTIQQELPPNIMLMLDDSGSMNWDFMPDAQYLSGHFWAYDENSTADYYVYADALRYSANNGVYFNPDFVYTVPSKADGTSYATPAGLASAYLDPFSDTTSTVDVTQYSSPLLCDYRGYDSNQSSNAADPCPNSLFYAFPYFTAFASANVASPTTCDRGTLQNGFCLSQSYKARNPNCQSGYSYNVATRYCEKNTTTVSYTYLFTYTTKLADGTYQRKYVGKSSTDCQSAPTGSTCVYDVTTKKNVAIWFSYYRTRLLMAKSGVMSAFADVDSSFRVGFGSINGNNDTNLPTASDTYGGRKLAQVKPFGATHKAELWSWLAGSTAVNGTPLRKSLAAVGEYYKDSQPWETMTSDNLASSYDNVELACRQAYTILTTDGFWNGGYTSDSTLNASDTAGPTVSGPNGTSFTYNPYAPYSGGEAVDKDGNQIPSLADVSTYYWKNDLRSTTANEVPTNDDDDAFWQHMVTFTMGLGVTPSGITPGTATTDNILGWAQNKDAPSNFAWPTPQADSLNNIADLAHAAINGHGNFYSASDPGAFASGLKDALKRAGSRVGTGASLAANSTQLKTGTMAYQANYFTGSWKGELKALPLDANSGAISNVPDWYASKELPAAAKRNIYTSTVATPTTAYVSFKNAATAPPSLSTGELSALGSGAAAQMLMVNYLRGDSTNEENNGGSFRDRETPLGDIVNSQPVFVGAPDANEFYGETFTGVTTYDGYASGTTDSNGVFTASAAASRTELIYVAANDGMLHAVDADSGKELYAYLPGAVIKANIAKLADPDYGTITVPHQFYNDGELTVADVYMGSAWKTVLVGTTGRGPAKAVYALDITSPGTDGSGIKFLWERSAGAPATDGNSKYIGEMTGKPVIAQVADGDWAVLVGNGYNSSMGTSALLQFKLTDGTLSVHPTTDSTTDNGLAAPVTWMGDSSNGISTAAYAGDLHGQVWSFQLYGTTSSSGSGNGGGGNGGGGNSTSGSTPTSTGVLLFTAKDGAGSTAKVEPITAGMLVGKKPNTNELWVFFGTGRYLSSADLGNTGLQSWYGLIVDDPDDSQLVSNLSKGRSALVQRSIIAETAGSAADLSATPPVAAILPARVVSAAGTNNDGSSDMTDKSGWYIDLQTPVTDDNGKVTSYTSQGERMVLPNQFQGTLLLGTTRIPVATDACNPSGTGWEMAIDPFTGANPSDAFFDLNGDGVIDSSDKVKIGGTEYPAAGIGFSSLPNSPIFVGGNMLMSFDNGTTSSLKTAGTTGQAQRVSWRELINQ